jgi:transforming growth factor-beta-induced protein
MKWLWWVAPAALSAVLVHGDSIAERLSLDGNFNTLLAAVGAADLGDALSDSSSALTVFAPDDAAFAKIAGVVDYLLVGNAYSNQLLTDVLLYHVLGQVKDSSVVNGPSTPLQGASMQVSVPSVNSGASMITEADIAADGGVIHKIDSVLIPPGFPVNTVAELVVSNGLSLLASALSAVDAVSTFQNAGGVYTVFAPTDAAFQAFFQEFDASFELFAGDATLQMYLQRILNAHVVADNALFLADVASVKKVRTLGGSIKTRDISPVATDVQAINGVVHVVDKVIISRICVRSLRRAILQAKENALQNPSGGGGSGTDTIAALASGSDELETLVAALGAAGLVGAVADPSASLTVFAPVDAAFDAIASVVGFLLIDNDYTKDLLTQLLLFHVLPKTAGAADLSASTTETTLSGQSLAVDIAGLLVNGDSSILTADIFASNGVVHTIDKVMLPPAFPTETIAGLAVGAGLSTLVQLLGAFDFVPAFAENQKTVHTVFAPTEAAFAHLESSLGTDLATIMGDKELRAALKSILALHYVAGQALDAAALASTRTIQIASGQMLKTAPILSTVAAADVKAVNGIVHIISEVIVTPRLAKSMKKRLKKIGGRRL